MAKPLLSLCRILPTATKDGDAGGTAHIYLPFHGLWYANGMTYPYTTTILQDKSRVVSGTRMADNYQKDCCCCS